MFVSWLCIATVFFVHHAVTGAAFSVDTSATYSIHAEWTVLDYLWDETHTRDSFLATGDFNPSNNALAGINVDTQGNIYVTVPRYENEPCDLCI